jgi:hypothetical protein
MILALLAGTKTQTRRKLPSAHPRFPKHNVLSLDVLSDPQQVWYWDGKHDRVGASHRLPIAAGDRIWVKETWRARLYDQAVPPRLIDPCTRLHYEADGEAPNCDDGTNWNRVRASIHMPRWASRLTLTVTDVRVQRLQDITYPEVLAEGIESTDIWKRRQAACLERNEECGSVCLDSFQELWDSINGPGAWDANPWVAAYTFDAHRCNIDRMPGF